MDEGQLARATQAAARSLAARGAATRADGSAFYCAYTGGTRVIVRNSLQHLAAFSGEQLLSQVSSEIVRALLARR